MGVSVYIGAEAIVSPLGYTAASNMEQVLSGHSGIALQKGRGWKGSDVYAAVVQEMPEEGKFERLLEQSLNAGAVQWDSSLLSSEDTLLIISSTKGGIADSITDPFHPFVSRLESRFSLRHRPLLISNACISGVVAINTAARLLKAGLYKHVVVAGCDVVSDFVLYGFQSLYAVSDEPCRPFDVDRKGVSLGEAGSSLVLSVEKSGFAGEPFLYLGGAGANDANHISGPSRTGEGLVRAVSKAIGKAGIDRREIGFINAHGTGTNFNDEMESIAFGRLGLEHVPLNSLKGYWGHTLGAAGVIETAACLQMMRRGSLASSLGYHSCGTSVPLNVLTENKAAETEIFLKTASGFGGGNAALIIKKI